MKKTLLSPTMKRTVFCFVAYSLFLSPLHSQIISTVAGNGTQSYTGDGGQATAATMNYTSDIAFDASGNMYISDDFNNVVRKVDNSGIITTIAGTGTAGNTGNGGQATAAELNSPSGVDVDANGNIYIIDQANNTVRIINTLGVINNFAGTGVGGFSGDGGQATNAQLSQPDKAAIDPNTGNVYIADYTNHRIRMVNTNGIITTVAGNGTSGFSGDGGQATAAQLNDPVGVFIDNTGNIYIGDYANNRVRKVNTLGIISTVVGTGVASSTGDGGPATAATVNNPAGIMVDQWGNLYVNEFFGHKTRVVNSSGTISTFAGTGSPGYTGDGGQATAATMSEPYGIRMDAAGNIYFADLANSVVREISGGPLAVKDAKATECSVYPNPANNNLTVQFSNIIGKVTITMYNVMGQQVLNAVKQNTATFTLPVARFNAGMYFIKVQTTDGTVFSKKITIIH